MTKKRPGWLGRLFGGEPKQAEEKPAPKEAAPSPPEESQVTRLPDDPPRANVSPSPMVTRPAEEAPHQSAEGTSTATTRAVQSPASYPRESGKPRLTIPDQPAAAVTRPTMVGDEPAIPSEPAAPPASSADHHAKEEDVTATWAVGDTILDLYEVKQVHEGGGMGLVYRVHHKNWNIDLAVKSPRPELLSEEGTIENFEHECETWVNLGLHPNTVSCHYVRRLGGIPRVFAEYIEGGDLEEWITERKLYEGGGDEALRRMLDIAIQFAWGLHHAHEHEQGLIHQDIKPANVMMTPEGSAKVTDFGLAKARASAGSVRGTEKYESPEQATGQNLTPKTDIWSWGVSILEMFTGDAHWRSGTVALAMLEIYMEKDGEDEDIPRMPGQLAELLRQCFQDDPASRPGDMRQVATAVRQVYEQLTGDAYPRQEPKAAELLADGLNNRAISMLDLGRKEDAERLFEQALEADGHHLETTYNLGLLRWRSARMTDVAVVRQLEEARTGHADGWYARALLARVHLERADAESALASLEEDPAPGKADADAKALLAEARRQLPESQRCLRTFKGHTKNVRSVCLSADGRLALSGSDDSTVKLWEVSTGRCLRTFEGHADSVDSVWLSADGRWALSGGGEPLPSADKSIKLWELATGRCLRSFEGHTTIVNSVCLSTDGRRALSGAGDPLTNEDKTLKLWDVATGRCLRTFEGHTYGVRSVRLSANGRRALSGSDDHTLKLWDVATGRCLRTFEGHTASVCSVCLSADNRLALSGSWDHTLKLWEVATGRCLRTFKGHTEIVHSVCLSADNRWALSGSRDKTLMLWDVGTGRCLRTFEGHTADVCSVCLSADGRWGLSGGGDPCGNDDRTLKLWQLKGSPMASFFEPSRPLASSDALTIESQYRESLAQAHTSLSAGDAITAADHLRRARSLPACHHRPEVMERWVQLYSLLPCTGFAGGLMRSTVEAWSYGEASVCLSADGRWALSGSGDNTLKLWEVATDRCLRTFEGHTLRNEEGYLHGVSSVCLSADGRWALSGSSDNTLKLWEVATGRCLRTFKGHTDMVDSICLSSDNRLALSGSWDYTLKLWEVATGCCLRTFKGHTRWVTSVCLSGDNRLALSGSWDYTLKLWDVATGRCLRTFEGHRLQVHSVCFSLDGRLALSGSQDKTLMLWDVGTGRCLRTFEGHTADVCSVCLSGDGRWALSGSDDQTLRLWEVATGRCMRTFEDHTSSVNSVCLSADGRFAMSGSGDGTLKTWTLDWELEDRQPADWDNGARPHLVNFLTLHTPYAASLPAEGVPRSPSDEQVQSALTRRGTPTWTDEDFQRLLHTLACAGYGWLRPEGVKHELERMAADWTGPPQMFDGRKDPS